jgi:hypothetical protein
LHDFWDDALDEGGRDCPATHIARDGRFDLVAHERADETKVYPRLARVLKDRAGLGAMSRAHREILHLARHTERLAKDLTPADADRYLVHDAQRVIEAIEPMVRLHNAQEEDIYEQAAG